MPYFVPKFFLLGLGKTTPDQALSVITNNAIQSLFLLLLGLGTADISSFAERTTDLITLDCHSRLFYLSYTTCKSSWVKVNVKALLV